MGDTQADQIKQEADQETEGTELQEGEAPAEDTGAIKCPKCTQVYGGPSSLKRHLWRIHRLSGDDAQALVDSAVAGTEEEIKEEAEEQEEQVDSDSSTINKQIKPLLEIAPTVRPLLSLPPEPPGYQANNFGGISPTPPAWTGGSAPPAGLLPTPGCGDMMTHEQDYISDPEEQQQQQQQQQQPSEQTTPEPGDGKIKPLMEVDLGKAGIPSLMSLPIMGQSPYMYSGGGMGGFYARNSSRRRERRSKPYNKDGNHNAGDQNGGHDNAGREDAGGVVSCAECGEEFQDSADLTDHEINSHNVGIDLNCDVELTA